MERLYDEIISKDIFRVVREEHGINFDRFIFTKVSPVAGDTRLEDLGIENSDLKEEMWSDIDAVVHQAATTRLDERYDTALDINTWSQKCHQLRQEVHKTKDSHSCFYCLRVRRRQGTSCTGKTVRDGGDIEWSDGLNIDAEKRLADNTLIDLQNKGASPKTIRKAMKDLGLQRSRKYGWPNAYVFSKAMGEMLIGELRENLHVAVVRPTLICSTYKDPFPGWIEGHGHIVIMGVGYAKGYLRFLRGDKDATLDLIPVDMLVNAMVAIMVAQDEQPSLTIYQVGSSLRNPISEGKTCDLHYKYLSSKKQWIDDKGVAVECPSPKKILITKSKLIFGMYCAKHILSLLVLKIVDTLSCGHHYKANYRRMMAQLVTSLGFSSELFRTYTCFSGIFDDQNSENLRAAIRKRGTDVIDCDFDPKSIEWEDYMLNTHIPGILHYCVSNACFGGY